MGFNLSYLFERQDLLGEAMRDILALLAAGRLKAPGVTPYPFANIAQAHGDLESVGPWANWCCSSSRGPPERRRAPGRP